MITYKSQEDFNNMKKAGLIVASIHSELEYASNPGTKIEDLDLLAEEIIKKSNSVSSFLNYRGYPSFICASPNDVIVHGIPRDYIIDKQDGIKEPLGMAGSRLEAKVHLVTCSENSSQNIHTCVKACGLEVEAFVLEQLASSYSVLTSDERELGVCLIDIGCGTTDIAVFTEGSISFTEVIPVAGDHVTNDIAQALRTPPNQAEDIKQMYGEVITILDY